MPFLIIPRLDTFARLLAKGYPPMLAAYRAGYANFSLERSQIRAALPEVVARVAGLRAGVTPRAAAPARTKAAQDTSAPAPADGGARPIEPMMTEEEWLEAYAPKPSAEAGAAL